MGVEVKSGGEGVIENIIQSVVAALKTTSTTPA